MKADRWQEALWSLAIVIVTEALVFGFPHWGMNAVGVALTPLWQLLISAVLFGIIAVRRVKRGKRFSLVWLGVIWGVSLCLDAFLAWYIVNRDL